MRMKAFGEKVEDVAAACTGPGASGRARLTTRPPPKTAPVLRKLRRSSRGTSELLDIFDPPSGGGTMDRGADALVGATAADIAGHGGVDIVIARLRGVLQQGRGRHDLPGL